jgi:hypothetical protein
MCLAIALPLVAKIGLSPLTRSPLQARRMSAALVLGPNRLEESRGSTRPLVWLNMMWLGFSKGKRAIFQLTHRLETAS